MTAPASLSGEDLRDAFVRAAQHLLACAKAVDAINVYPVPDGDTGTNMAGTLREAVDAALLVPGPATVAEVLGALAQGALYGARGNSGVILSQALRGLARGVARSDPLDAAALAAGLSEAAHDAYAAVGKPVEGTMLTVLRAAGEAAAATVAAASGGLVAGGCAALLAAALRAAETAEAATIDQLPALREAGVTDAGGEGVCVILRGLVVALEGRAPEPPAIPERPIATMAGHAAERFGYCTEFVLEPEGRRLDIEAVRALVSRGDATSVVVVGDERAVRVHVHTATPQSLLEATGQLGRVTRTKIDDMTAQNVRWGATGSGASARVAVLSLSRGQGFDAIFESLGVHVSDLGEVVKPPAGEIAAAADALGVPDVLVLPNHANVVLAARQAASLARCTLHVVPTESLVQGIAAALAFEASETAPVNQRAMGTAREAVRTVEVTRAAANRTTEGLRVRAGNAIALVDGRLVATGEDIVAALVEGLRAGGAATASLVTVYTGAEAIAAFEDVVAAAFPGVEVQCLAGGQPLYTYIASIE